jgi:DNA mismatch repair ATPase MutS
MKQALDILSLDAHTIEDLGLFDSSADSGGLFEFCNRCKTDKGSEALRRRMLSPWANPARIRATQESMVFIGAHRHVFSVLPSAYLALNIERYLSGGMPAIQSENSVEFGMDAFHLWANYDQFYSKIIHGIELSRRFLSAMRQRVDSPETSSLPGEVGDLLVEMRGLVQSPKLIRVYESAAPTRYWQKLRVDQILRVRERTAFQRMLVICYELDALVAMADVTSQSDFTMPVIDDSDTRIQGTGLVHPMLTAAVPNPVALNQSRRLLLLTGPNMAGKTTYLRALLTALYFAHLGMGVPAAEFSFSPLRHLISSISLSDNLSEGVSYFRAEALRVKAIATAVHGGGRTVAIMDEPFKGTNVKDAFDASFAVLEKLAEKTDCLIVVSSHLIELAESLESAETIKYCFFEAEEEGARLSFDYRLKTGVSQQRLGMRVLEEEGVFELLK